MAGEGCLEEGSLCRLREASYQATVSLQTDWATVQKEKWGVRAAPSWVKENEDRLQHLRFHTYAEAVSKCQLRRGTALSRGGQSCSYFLLKGKEYLKDSSHSPLQDSNHLLGMTE